MALPSAGNPISFKDINEEIGNTGNAELDLKTAGETFGDTEPFGMDELLGQSSARLQLTIKYLVQQEQGESDRDTGWISTASSISSTKGELVLCAEAAAVAEDARSNGLEFLVDTENTDFNSDGTVSNGDTLFNSNSGATLSSRRPDSGLINQETFLCETTQNNIFQVNSSGVLSNVRSRTPDVPTKPTLVADSGTQVTVTIPTTNTVVTREFKLQRSIDGGSYSDRATFVPSDSGSIDDTSIGTTFVDDSGLSAGDVVRYKVRAQNAFANSSFSTISDAVTTPAGTSLSASPSSAAILIGSDAGTIGPAGFSDAITVSVTNRQGNIDVTRTQNTSGTFTVAAGTSDPGTGGTYLTAVSNINSDTVVVRGKFDEAGRDVSEGPTNNVITLTDDVAGTSISINISCRVTNF
tara:strand:+ start:1755 stop:2984 length:1230 start_codon:yes stop_codon:yes gene_type:complete